MQSSNVQLNMNVFNGHNTCNPPQGQYEMVCGFFFIKKCDGHEFNVDIYILFFYFRIWNGVEIFICDFIFYEIEGYT